METVEFARTALKDSIDGIEANEGLIENFLDEPYAKNIRLFINGVDFDIDTLADMFETIINTFDTDWYLDAGYDFPFVKNGEISTLRSEILDRMYEEEMDRTQREYGRDQFKPDSSYDDYDFGKIA